MRAAYAALEAVSASATRSGDIREWEHVRRLGRWDVTIEAECDRRIAGIRAIARATSEVS